MQHAADLMKSKCVINNIYLDTKVAFNNDEYHQQEACKNILQKLAIDIARKKYIYFVKKFHSSVYIGLEACV